MARSIYVISDLHLGGRPPSGGGSDRGFRIMSRPEALAAFVDRIGAEPGAELVINGDFVDFLAEEHQSAPRFRAFIDDPHEAVGAFESIYQASSEAFDALGKFARAHPLTILLGNHDLELVLPDVRASFESRLGLAAGRYRFLHDNEALILGTALIEHGNRYDPANIVDHDGLRRIRSLHSRRQYEATVSAGFSPPPGSELVATVMNPIKLDYPFIDLLKPESEPLFALLLALDPGCRGRLARLAWTMRRVPARMVTPAPDLPTFRREISSVGEGRQAEEHPTAEDALCALLADNVPRESLAVFDEQPAGRREISGAGARAVLEGLVLGRHWGWERRIEQIRGAVVALGSGECFSRDVETGGNYLDAASALADRGSRFSHVIFGHTHRVKDIDLGGRARYLNSGAWADHMRFPKSILSTDPETSRQAVETLLIDCARKNLRDYVEFEPGCVHIEVGAATSARYRAYDAQADLIER